MKWELDDNTSDGIRFLLIGAGSLLLLRLGYAGVLQLVSGPPKDALAEACAYFQSGYWIADPHTVVLDGGADMVTRIALAVIITVVVALLLAGLAQLLSARFGQGGSTWTVRVLRVALIIPFCWWLFAALTRPPVELHFNSAGFAVRRQAALFGRLSLPWPAEHITHRWDDFEGIITTEVEHGTAVLAIASEDTMILGVGHPKQAHLLAEALRTLAGRP